MSMTMCCISKQKKPEMVFVATEKHRRMIIIGYQGIGKSTVCKDNPRYIDFESSALKLFGRRPPNWELPYCQMAVWLSKQGYVVFTSSHKEVRKLLTKSEEYCIAIVPSLELEEEWLERLKTRYEKSDTEKDLLAYLNAQDRYKDNISEIMRDVADTFVIKEMDYDLKQIVGKCEKIKEIVTRDDLEGDRRMIQDRSMDIAKILNHYGRENQLLKSI